MHASIRRIATWLWLLFAPGTGRRRAGARPVVPPSPVHPPVTDSLPAHRSPYGLHEPIDGAASPLVRPYLVDDERHRRRLALVLAADFGVDLDQHLVGAGAVA